MQRDTLTEPTRESYLYDHIRKYKSCGEIGVALERHEVATSMHGKQYKSRIHNSKN